MNSKIIQAFFTNGFGPLQRRPGQPGGASERFALDPGRLNLAGSVGRSMPEAVLRKMEQVFKADFSDVRIHQGPQAGSIGAHAFTMGSSIYFAPGQYSPDTARGQQLLGHELTHVLQQRGGRVRTPQGGGMMVVNDHALEAEADRMGVIAASFRPPLQAKMAAPMRPGVPAKPASHKLVIGAYMHQGAAGGGAPPDLAGHAFVSVQGPTGKRETWGFSPANYSRYNPQKDIGKLRAGVPGVVHRDDHAFSKPGVKTRSYELTPAQAKAAMAKIDEYKTRQYKFSAQSRQCTTFANDVLGAASGSARTLGRSPTEMFRNVGLQRRAAVSGTAPAVLPATMRVTIQRAAPVAAVAKKKRVAHKTASGATKASTYAYLKDLPKGTKPKDVIDIWEKNKTILNEFTKADTDGLPPNTTGPVPECFVMADLIAAYYVLGTMLNAALAVAPTQGRGDHGNAENKLPIYTPNGNEYTEYGFFAGGGRLVIDATSGRQYISMHYSTFYRVK